MNENDFRDVCAMLALVGYLSKNGTDAYMFETCFNIADAMVEERKRRSEPKPEEGIKAIRKRKRVEKE